MSLIVVGSVARDVPPGHARAAGVHQHRVPDRQSGSSTDTVKNHRLS